MCNQTCVFDVCVSFLCVYREACVWHVCFLSKWATLYPNTAISARQRMSLSLNRRKCLKEWLQIHEKCWHFPQNYGLDSNVTSLVQAILPRQLIVSDFSAISMIYQPDTDHIEGNVATLSGKTEEFWFLCSGFWLLLLHQCWCGGSVCSAGIHGTELWCITVMPPMDVLVACLQRGKKGCIHSFVTYNLTYK